MTRFDMPISFWFVRAPFAVVGGVIIGQIAQVPLALLLDLIWQNDVTGGRMALHSPQRPTGLPGWPPCRFLHWLDRWQAWQAAWGRRNTPASLAAAHDHGHNECRPDQVFRADVRH